MKITSFKPADIFQLVAEGRIPSQAWLAEKIGIKPGTFNKMLNHGKDIPGSTNEKINEVLKKEGVITDQHEQASFLIMQTMSTSAIVNQQLGQLNEITLKLAGDTDGLTFNDKVKLLNYYDDMLDEIKEKIYQLRRAAEGRK